MIVRQPWREGRHGDRGWRDRFTAQVCDRCQYVNANRAQCEPSPGYFDVMGVTLRVSPSQLSSLQR
jgi:hypothetical protein